MSENTVKRDSDKFPCPTCGGDMHFDPETGNMKCMYCDNIVEFDEKSDEIKEYDFFTAPEDPVNDEKWGKSTAIKCENCGAETILNEEAVSDFCAFCGSAHIVKLDELTGIPPESVLPFKISRDKAKKSFRHWLKKRFFAPKALKTDSSIGQLNGTYVPYWTYDSDISYTYRAEAGTHYTVTVNKIVNGKSQPTTETRTRWRSVHGADRKYFDDVQVRATNKLPDDSLKKLEPFPLKKLTPFKPEYLSGFIAERYSIDLKTGWESAKTQINYKIEQLIRDSVNADEVRNVRVASNYNQVLYKHILVPVWLSSYLFKGKTYQCMVNGANGRVSGKAPVSVPKVILTVFIVIAVIALLMYILSITR